jgi:hypothetical protein
MRRIIFPAVVLVTLAAGCGGESQDQATRPPEGFQGPAPSKQQAAKKFGAKPGVSEYRVHSDLVLNLGKGVSGSVSAQDHFKCVNANGEFPFKTTTDDKEKHDLWIDASTSVIPPCFQDASYQYFDVNISAPYTGALSVRLGQEQAGSEYSLKCPDRDSARVGCRQKGKLSVEITCIPPVVSSQPRCVKEPGPPNRR